MNSLESFIRSLPAFNGLMLLTLVGMWGGWQVMQPKTAVSETVYAQETAVLPIASKPLHLTYHNPELGGINCQHPCDVMANGQTIQESDWWGQGSPSAVACPAGWMGRVLEIEGIGRVVCKDRGGAIVEKSDRIHIDILSRTPVGGYLESNWRIVE